MSLVSRRRLWSPRNLTVELLTVRKGETHNKNEEVIPKMNDKRRQ